MPDSLVLKRWTKNAKDSISVCTPINDVSNDPTMTCQFTNMVERCKRMAVAAVKCQKPKLLRSTFDLIDEQTKVLENACTNKVSSYVPHPVFFEETLLNPDKVRTKGCGATPSTAQRKRKDRGQKAQTCGICKIEGHNRKSCPVQSQNRFGNQAESNAINNGYDDECEVFGDVGNVDMVSYF